MDAADAGFAGTMRAAIKGALRLDAVADDFAIAVLAFWGERVNCAFKAVKIVRLPHDGDLQRFVVIVPANFTFVHTSPPSILRSRRHDGAPRERLRPSDHVL